MRNLKIADKETRTAPTENIPENLLAPVEPTLVANMERVVELAVELKLSDTLYSVAESYLGFIAERMPLTAKQSLFLEQSSNQRIEVSDFSRMVGCRTIRILSLMSEVDALAERKLICRKKISDNELFYRMPAEVVTALKNNTVYTPRIYCGAYHRETYRPAGPDL